MQLEPNPGEILEDVYVVFVDNTSLWWLRLLKNGFRHCYLLYKLKSANGWLEINPYSNQTIVKYYSYPPDFDFPLYLRNVQNARLCRLSVAYAPPVCAPVSFCTCVEFVKRAIGIHDKFIHTPYQLYKKITNCRK